MASALSIETYKRQLRITSVVLRQRYKEDSDRPSYMDHVIFSKAELMDYYGRVREKLLFARETLKIISSKEERNTISTPTPRDDWSEIHNAYMDGNWLDKFHKTTAQIAVFLQEIAYCRETLVIKD